MQVVLLIVQTCKRVNGAIPFCRPLLQFAFQNLAVINDISEEEWELSLASGEQVVVSAVNTTEVLRELWLQLTSQSWD